MQPSSMVLELSGAVCVYGDVAVAFVLFLDYYGDAVSNGHAICVYDALVLVV